MIIDRLPRLLRIPWRSSRIDVDDELRFHIDMASADLVAGGADPSSARLEAERRFGAVGEIRDAVLTIDERRRRRADKADLMTAFLADLRFAARSLRKTPLLTVVGSLTLMLGVGATTAIFSVVNGVVLRPLPYVNADRLTMLRDVQPDGADTPLSYPEFQDWQTRGTQAFPHVGAWFPTGLTLTGVDQPAVLSGERMSHEVPALLGVTPILGRTFRADEDGVTADRVIMLSEETWRRRFNADSTVIGRTLELSGYAYTVIGVYPSNRRSRLPNELTAVHPSDYWQALRLDVTRGPRGLHFLSVMAAAKPGLTMADVQRRVATVNGQLHADSVTSHSVAVFDLAARVIGPARGMLGAMFAAVVLVLLVACANVANLLLARGAARQREIAVRTALGAGRARIMSQLLAESVLRALVGGLLGVAFAYLCILWLQHSSTVQMPRFADVSIDLGVLAFALLLSLLTGVAFGIVPALRSARTDPNAVMREGGRSIAGSLRRDAFRRSLIVGEVVLSFMLLVGAGLFLRSLDRLMKVPMGFAPDRVLSSSVFLPASRYADSTAQIAFFRRFLGAVRNVPGVSSVGLTSNLPVEGGTNGSIGVEGRTFGEGKEPVADKRIISPGYFATIGARIVAGRDIDDGDVIGANQVVVVNEAFAARLFPGENAVGKRVDFEWNTKGFQTVVGVVANVKEQPLDNAVTPSIYISMAQRPSEFMYLVAKTSADPLALLPAVRRELRAIDRNLPLDQPRTFTQIINDGTATQRLTASLLSTFSIAALLLAGIGLYGVISYSVAQRTQELGIRAALGAQRRNLLGDIMGEGLVLVAAGVVLGGLAARAAATFIASQLFGVTTGDLAVYGAVAAVLALVSVIALLAPAMRAARIDPAIALREE